MPTLNSGNSKTQRLLSRTATRLRYQNLGRRFFAIAIGVAVLVAILILVTRLTSSLPAAIASFPILSLIPFLALVVAWCTHARVSPDQAAAAVDHYQQNHDLFLTAVHLDGSAGSYQENVRKRAEHLAANEVPLHEIVPWSWQRPGSILSGIVALLALGIAFLPQLDPFGKQEQRDWLDKQEQRLAELHKETLEAVATRRPEELAQRSETIQQSLSELEKTFRNAKPEYKQENANKLSQNQNELSKFWKQLNDEKLGKALTEANNQLQQFGQTDSSDPEVAAFREKLRQLLAEGDAEAMKEAISKMLQKAEDLQNSGTTPQQQQAQQQQGVKELRQAMQDLAEAVSKETQSPQIDQALKRAIEQLQTAQNENLAEQALQDAQETIKSLEQQLQDLGEQLKQLEALEKALDAAQLAQQLNDLGELGKGGQSGEGAGNKSLSDYAQLYKQMLEQQGQGGQGNAGGQGMGMGGPGQGQGGTAPEEDSGDTEFTSEQSKSALVAGKMLMEWKTKGVSETGEATQEFRDSVRNLKQGISEAIRNEQIPAGYHEQIKRYFDTLPEAPTVSPDID